MKQYLKEYVYNNIKIISIIMMCLIIGITIGVIIFNYSNQEVKEKLINLSSETLKTAKNENFEGINILLSGIKNNIPVICIVYFSAITYIPLLLINIVSILKGISIGIYIAILVSLLGITKGIILSLIIIVFPNVIYTMAYIYICNNSIVLHNKIKDGICKIYDVFLELINVIISIFHNK